MSHPITDFQAALVPALGADPTLLNLLGGAFVFDAPPKGQRPPYVAISRHDVLSRDGDLATGHDHRLLLTCWTDAPSRETVVAIAERVVALALTTNLSGASLTVTHAQHDRTDTAIDPKTGFARATMALRFFSEPAA